MKYAFLEILLLAQHKTDPNLALHAKRVACYAAELAKALGYHEQHKKIFMAGLLHDLGFLSLDIHFSEGGQELTKPQSVNEFEHHAIESERLLATLTTDKELLSAIRHHHEGYTGEGYPDQLAGDEIPLAARILAVADTYDTLLIGKLYGKRRLTSNDAIEQMTGGNNSIHLDPEMVKTFTQLLAKNPVLFQPEQNNRLGIYQIIFLRPGLLEQGDLINQDGTVLIKQGFPVDERTLEKMQQEFPGQKLIQPVEKDLDDSQT